MDFTYYVLAALLVAHTAYGAGVAKCFACMSPDCYTSDGTGLLSTNCIDLQAVSGTSFMEQFEPLFAKYNVSAAAVENILRNSKSTRAFEVTSDTMICIKLGVTHETLDGTYGIRGCAPTEIFTRDVCRTFENLMELVAGSVEDCNTCDEDLCNSALSLSQIPVYLVGIFTLLRLYS